jgi:hypothetical protein
MDLEGFYKVPGHGGLTSEVMKLIVTLSGWGGGVGKVPLPPVESPTPLTTKTYVTKGHAVDVPQGKLQWAMHLLIWHGPDFGHMITLQQQRQGADPETVDWWKWKGLGVPKEVLDQVQAWTSAVVADHLVFRYGVQDILFKDRPEEISPF